MNNLNNIFRKFLYFLFFVLIVSGAGYWYFSSHVFIDPVDYVEFNRSVPISKDACRHTGTIKYYEYKEVPEEERKNNKFGLYIYPDNEKFIDLADDLVNSSGGEWGYVLLPFNVQEHDEGKWRRVFYLLNENQLVPIVQLWNVNPDDYKDETEEAAEFLNQFIWPVKQRYVSVYNEPNSDSFWYGQANPEQYAEILDYTIDVFKNENENYFMINGALNVSARSGPAHMDAFLFMDQMNESVPGIFEKIDGWASHSYPQPNFSGRPLDQGRDSIRAYETELNYLENNFGVKDLPVFITETGWAHDVGVNYDPSYLSIDTVSEYFETAYEEVWLPDNRVQAVTPFTIWYQPPADHFSWVDNRYVPYKHFQTVKEIDKVSGNPESLIISSADAVGCNEN